MQSYQNSSLFHYDSVRSFAIVFEYDRPRIAPRTLHFYIAIVCDHIKPAAFSSAIHCDRLRLYLSPTASLLRVISSIALNRLKSPKLTAILGPEVGLILYLIYSLLHGYYFFWRFLFNWWIYGFIIMYGRSTSLRKTGTEIVLVFICMPLIPSRLQCNKLRYMICVYSN